MKLDTPIDYYDENASPAQLKTAFKTLFPQCKPEGQELCVGDIDGIPGKTLKYSLRKRVWHEFDPSSGSTMPKRGGGIINLIMYRENLPRRRQAIDWFCKETGFPPPGHSIGTPNRSTSHDKGVLLQLPTGSDWLRPAKSPHYPDPPKKKKLLKGNNNHSNEEFTLEYAAPFNTETGQPFYLDCRYVAETLTSEKGKKRKEHRVWAQHAAEGWKFGGPDKDQRIFGNLENLVTTEKEIIIVEGGWTGKHAAALCPDYCVTYIAYGVDAFNDLPSEAWQWADGKTVTYWPDNDKPGIEMAATITEKLYAAGATSVSVVQYTQDYPRSWDAADPLPEGYSVDDLLEARIEIPKYGPHNSFIHAVLPLDEFVAFERTPLQWLVRDMVVAGEYILLSGTRGGGKTALTMQLCKSLTLAQPFLGYEVPEKRAVLYIDGEMTGQMMAKRVHMMFGEIPSNFFMLSQNHLAHVSGLEDKESINLGQEKVRAAITNTIRAVEQKYKVKLSLIVMDNLSTLVQGVDENSSTENQDLLAWIRDMRHEGYTPMIVHHTGNNDQSRGTTARQDAAGLCWTMLPKDKKRMGLPGKLTTDKYRAGANDFPVFVLELVPDQGRPKGVTVGGDYVNPMMLTFTAEERAAFEEGSSQEEKVDAILKVVAEKEGKLTKNGIAVEMEGRFKGKKGYGKTAIGDLVEWMEGEGMIYASPGRRSKYSLGPGDEG